MINMKKKNAPSDQTKRVNESSKTQVILTQDGLFITSCLVLVIAIPALFGLMYQAGWLG